MNNTKKRTFPTVVCIVAMLLIPVVIAIGIYVFEDRKYYFISICILLLAMLPFLASFEARRPQTRELLLLAVMITIGVAGRAAFFMVPQFKPVAAIVIITGCSLSPQAGFLTGVMTAFVSNFFFGQGPWTPWQMFAFGMVGFLAGVLFSGKRKKWKKNKVLLCSYGAIAVLFVYGILMDTASALMLTSRPTWKALLAVYASGVPFNILHAISTVVFLAVLAEPMFRKLDRIKRRYGMLKG